MVAGDTYHVTNEGHIVLGDAGSANAPNNSLFREGNTLYQKTNNTVAQVGEGSGGGTTRITSQFEHTDLDGLGSAMLFSLPSGAVLHSFHLTIDTAFNAGSDATGVGPIGSISELLGKIDLDVTGTASGSAYDKGDVLYSTTGSTDFYIHAPMGGTGTWSSENALSTSRTEGHGFGTKTAAVCVGGDNDLTSTEEFDGTNWSAGGALNTGKEDGGMTGVLTAGLIFGGRNGGADDDATEEYNGTSWSAGGNLTAAIDRSAGAGTQTDALSAAGNDSGNDSSASEEYNGTSWSSGGSLSVAKQQCGGAGDSTSDAIIFAGKDGGVAQSSSEEYNGTSFSAGGALNQSTYGPGYSSNAATSNALSCGGFDGSARDEVESYNGTAWTSLNVLPVGRFQPDYAGNDLGGVSFGGGTTATNSFNLPVGVFDLSQGQLTIRALYSEDN